jgi:hypothetical protein
MANTAGLSRRVPERAGSEAARCIEYDRACVMVRIVEGLMRRYADQSLDRWPPEHNSTACERFCNEQLNVLYRQHDALPSPHCG